MLGEEEWCVVGTYRWRPFYQDYNNSGEGGLFEDVTPPDDVPIILYDAKEEKGDMLAPRYVAAKVSIPQTSDRKVKVFPGSADVSTKTPVVPLDPSLNCRETVSTSGVSSHTKKGPPLVVATTLPQPLHTIFVLPFAILLADIAIAAAGVTTVPTSPALIATSCLLVIAPDVVVIGLILRRGRVSTAVAIHLALWPSVAFLFIFPFVSMIFVVHMFFSFVLLVFLFRLRLSTHTTFVRFN
ncbi:uncharacterized protein TM35_000231100 [Trypanosoma theileri]|uniref:Uncharacterized protein n=1 Tax=Trypanosoma theileri TaxID=67003 RepID=A0A1X0NSH8_9TRYP|nr:uncharacterized protein TM35_000231100 [Trypanosoma theileri]ORC87139.1 hypothetical protein TM35_000231100 [Trypanosoma theileri]